MHHLRGQMETISAAQFQRRPIAASEPHQLGNNMRTILPQNRLVLMLSIGLALALAFIAFLLVGQRNMGPSPATTIAEGRAMGERASEATSSRRAAGAANGASQGASTASASTRPRPSASPARDLVTKSRDLKATYTQLGALGGNTAENRFYQAAILEKCAEAGYGSVNEAEVDRMGREKFAGKPNEKQRLAAWEQMKARRLPLLCAGFADAPPTPAQASAAMREAAQAGDPRARARMIEAEVLSNAKEVPSLREDIGIKLKTPVELTKEQVTTVQRALETRDPTAILQAGPLLTNAYSNMSVLFGENSEAISPAATDALWQLIACDFGANCDGSMTALLLACAHESRCNASDYASYLSLYEFTPQQADQVARMRALIGTAIMNADWSQVVVSRDARSSGLGFVPARPQPIRFGI
jgi:hypothetical protein